MTAMNILTAENLKKYYSLGENKVKALDGVSLKVERGEFLAIVGRSGSGKSTLLHMLGGLDTPTSGRVMVGGKDISAMSPDELTIFRRRKIGFVFQDYNLLPTMNLYENVVLPIQLDGVRPDKRYVEHILEILGLKEKKYAMPGQLSGGQQQRTAIARALIYRPAIVLADEPTGNLDRKNSEEIVELLKLSNKNLNQTILLITHDEKVALETERVVTLEDGRIISDRKRG